MVADVIDTKRNFMVKKYELSDPEVRENIKDYILLMLGAPVVKIELDDKQVDLCVNRTCDMMDTSERVSKWSNSFKLMVAQDGALAQAKLILGRVRSKYGLIGAKEVKTKPKSTKTQPVFQPLDGDKLLEEGERQYHDWQKKVFGKVNGNN
jgi:hypothetical protein